MYNHREEHRKLIVQRYVHSSACFPTVCISATSGYNIYIYIIYTVYTVDVHMEYGGYIFLIICMVFHGTPMMG